MFNSIQNTLQNSIEIADIKIETALEPKILLPKLGSEHAASSTLSSACDEEQVDLETNPCISDIESPLSNTRGKRLVNEEQILKRRKKKLIGKGLIMSLPKKPLTAYAIFVKQVSL